MRGRFALLGAVFLLCALAGSARASTVLVLTGRGWGHGVGMSQWGAYGYALHGWDYRRILAHYYPGTRLGRVGEPRVRVLLRQDARLVRVGCVSRMSVSDATGMGHPLRAGTYGVGPQLVLPLRRVRVRVGRRHRVRVVRRAGRRLRSPVVFQCARNPLVVDGHAYHGRIVLRSAGGRLSVVDSLPLDTYLRGVVGAEMPSHWSEAALEAQAVAARSYAVATLRPGAPFDEYADQRSQAYGGIAAEGPRTDRAVAATAGQVLTWEGRVATAYYSASSGGRTADIRDLWPALGPVPYLRPVADPYDVLSPHHEWGPVAFTPARLGRELGLGGAVDSLRIEKSPSGRVAALDLSVGSGRVVRVPGRRVERQLGLRSTWFSVGELSLDAAGTRVLFGRPVRLGARVSGAGTAELQRRLAGGAWQDVRRVRSRATLTVEPRTTTQYRLSIPGVQGPTLAVAVAPRLRVQALGANLLGGTILPRPTGAVTVWRRVAGEWRLVARPRVDAHGVFRTPLRLRAGGYRIEVAGDGRLAAAQTRLRVTKRLLASFRRR